MSNSENSELIFASWINLQATQLGSHNPLQASSFMTIPFPGVANSLFPRVIIEDLVGLVLEFFFYVTSLSCIPH